MYVYLEGSFANGNAIEMESLCLLGAAATTIRMLGMIGQYVTGSLQKYGKAQGQRAALTEQN